MAKGGAGGSNQRNAKSPTRKPPIWASQATVALARTILYDPRWPILSRDEERPPVLLREGAEVDDLVAYLAGLRGES